MRLQRALNDGDLVICATPTQRELYDRARDRLIEVPFGAEQDFGQPTSDNRQPIIIWGGGTWEWLDPKTAVEAPINCLAK